VSDQFLRDPARRSRLERRYLGRRAKTRTAAKVAKGKRLNDLRGTFATRLMVRGFEDREIDEVMGWETGKSARIRRRYISRKAVVMNAIERMRRT
jgi:hypothetical protein